MIENKHSDMVGEMTNKQGTQDAYQSTRKQPDRAHTRWDAT